MPIATRFADRCRCHPPLAHGNLWPKANRFERPYALCSQAAILEGMAETTAYLNGQWVPASALCLPIDDLGFLLGTTLVERMRTFSGKIFRLDDHLQRLQRSLEIVGWDAEAIGQQVALACEEFLHRNPSLVGAGDDCGIVVFITPGKTRDASQPTVCVHGHPLPFYDWARDYETGVEAMVVEVRQVPSECWPAELKCRSRMHYYLADREADSKAQGSKAILLAEDGNVGEGSTANVVAYFADGGLVTPRRTKVLPGVSQQVLFELADSLGLPHCEEDMSPERLGTADEAFFTSTSSCLLPIVRFNDRPLGEGTPGPLFKKLLAAWSKLVGVEICDQAKRFEARSYQTSAKKGTSIDDARR